VGEDVGWNGSARVWLGGWSGDIRCGEDSDMGCRGRGKRCGGLRFEAIRRCEKIAPS